MAKTKKRRSFGKFLVDCVYSLVSFIALVMLMWSFLFSFVLRTVQVDGQSMQDTLQNRQRMLLIRALYTPQRGDIVVANRLDSTETTRLGVSTYREPIIKRVIGVGGDVVEVTKDAVYVNGAEISEPYVHYENSHEGITYVPEGTVFVMGDHRNASTDSRSTGPVQLENVMGHVVARMNSLTDFDVMENVTYDNIPAAPSQELVDKALKAMEEKAAQKAAQKAAIEEAINNG